MLSKTKIILKRLISILAFKHLSVYLHPLIFINQENYMIQTEQVLEKVVEGIQERKGKRIVSVDMSQLQDAPCSYFVIAEGDSRVHVNAIAESVKDWVRDEIKVKPYAVDGVENAEWIAMDYGDIIVHIFQREARAFYDIEHLWEDAKLTEFEDLD